MTAPCPGPDAPVAPKRRPPAGACDSHIHVLGPYDRYPMLDERPYTAPEAPVEAARAYLDTMGLARVVIAQVSVCGTDNRVTLDAVAALGKRARGLAIVDPGASESELADLHAAGMRGVRVGYNEFRGPADVARAGERVAGLGWHVGFWPKSADEVREITAAIDALPTEVVINHLAGHCFDPAGGVGQPGFQAVRDLLKSGRAWLKLSAMCRSSKGGYPWPELAPFARAFAEEFPARCLWASDWPHVGLFDNPMPRTDHNLDWFLELGLDEATERQILVDNPARLYGFDD